MSGSHEEWRHQWQPWKSGMVSILSGQDQERQRAVGGRGAEPRALPLESRVDGTGLLVVEDADSVGTQEEDFHMVEGFTRMVECVITGVRTIRHGQSSMLRNVGSSPYLPRFRNILRCRTTSASFLAQCSLVFGVCFTEAVLGE